MSWSRWSEIRRGPSKIGGVRRSVIDTVIFDFGNVLVGWDPYRAYRGHTGADGRVWSTADVDAFFEEVGFAALNHEADAGRPFADIVAQVARTSPARAADLAVYVEPAVLDRPGFGIDAELSSELQAALGRSDVDVVLLNRASPLLYHRVIRDGVCILSRLDTATTTREGYALSRYCDYLPQLRKIEALHRARIETGRFGR